jgi:DNA helicase-2/ATP-dependent DNA helicase PcrA
LLILAGAGTGKTRTLVARAAWLAGQGMQPSRILLLTFTRRAADDMLSRATARARTADGRITGGTFHAIAHRIIRQHAEAFSLPPEFTVIDPADMADLLDARRADHGLAGTQRRAPRASVCADIYTRCVNTQTTVADVVRRDFPWCEDYTGQLAELFRAYVTHKRGHALVDFDDLLLLWRAALADPAAGPVLRGMFDAVLVDEYQDVNAVQADIVRLLQPEAGCLTCVGDDAQAIYAFRGADPQHLHRLADAFPGLTVVRLVQNYRSRQAVLRLANTVRPQSAGLELALTAARETGAAPVLVRCHDEATQAREICARVLDAHESGTELHDQAVLVRAAHHSDVLEIELAARGIPFIKYGGLRFTEAAHVKDFLAAARIVANPADDVAWFRVLRLHEGIGAAHARRIIDVLRPADPAPFGRWEEAVAAAPRRARDHLAATIGGLAKAAVVEHNGELATRCGRVTPMRTSGSPTWSGSPTRPRAGRRCTTRWSSWRSTHRCRPPISPGRPGRTTTSWSSRPCIRPRASNGPWCTCPTWSTAPCPATWRWAPRPGWPRNGGCSTSRSPAPAISCSCMRRCACTTTGWPATTGTATGS